jgi:hypothetical protein
MLCSDFIQKIAKRFPNASSSSFGLFVPAGKRPSVVSNMWLENLWLEDIRPLFFYRKILQANEVVSLRLIYTLQFSVELRPRQSSLSNRYTSL